MPTKEFYFNPKITKQIMIYSKNISTNNYLNQNSKSKSNNNERNNIDLVTKWKTNDKHL